MTDHLSYVSHHAYYQRMFSQMQPQKNNIGSLGLTHGIAIGGVYFKYRHSYVVSVTRYYPYRTGSC